MTEAAPPKTPKHPRFRKVLRWTLRIVGGLLLFILLAVAGTVTWLTTDSGNAFILKLGLKQANSSLQGHVSARHLSFGLKHIRLEGVELKDPDGGEVAKLGALDVRFSLMAMLHMLVHVSSIQIESPDVRISSDSEGMNLTRAIAARNPSPPTPPSPPSKSFPVSVQVDSLSLTDGTIDFRQRGDNGWQVYHLDDLGLNGNARLHGADKDIAAHLVLTSQLADPVKGPVRIEVDAQDSKGTQHAQLTALLAGAKVEADATLKDGMDHADVVVKTLSVPPSLAKAFLPSYPVSVPLIADAVAHKNGDQVTAHLGLSAGKGRLTADARADVKKLEVASLVVEGKDLNLTDLLENAPPTQLRLSLKAAGGGKSLETAHGFVDLDVPDSPVRGKTLGPIRAHLTIDHGAYDVRQLLANLPGLAFTANGQGTLKKLALTAHLNATDLAALASTVGALSEAKVPAVAGKGSLQLSVSGSMAHPGVSAQGGFDTLRFQDNVVTKLQLVAQVPDVKNPLASNLQLSAQHVAAAGKKLDDVQVAVKSQQRALTVDVSTKGGVVLGLHAAGIVDADSNGILLGELGLRYPEASWQLEKATHVHFGGDELSTEPLVLTSGNQNIFVEGKKVGDKVDAHVELNRVDLGKLPHAVIPREMNLAGLVSVKATARGTLKKPEATLMVDVAHARYQHYQDLNAHVQGGYTKARAAGDLELAAAGVTVHGKFDVPVQALLDHRHVATTADIELTPFNIQSVLCTLSKTSVDLATLCDRKGKAIANGTARASIKVTGTADAPELAVDVGVQQLTYNQLPPFDVTLTAGNKGRHDDTLAAEVLLAGFGGKLDTKVETQLTPAKLLGNGSGKNKLDPMKQPIHLAIALDHLDLAPASRALDVGEDIKGVLTMKGDFRGPPLGVEGQLRADVKGLVAGPMTPTDAVFTFDSKSSSVQVLLDAKNAHGQLANLKVYAPAALARFTANLAGVEKVPLTADLQLGPVQLTDLPALTQGNPRSAKKLHGSVAAHLAVRGSLADPTVDLKVGAENVGVDKDNIGKIDVGYQYGKTLHKLAMRLSGASGGHLDINAGTTLDVSYPALKKGITYGTAPVNAQMTSEKFDLGFLSGLAPSIRKMAGQLIASASLTGNLGSPRFQGALELKDAAINTEGFGNFDAVHLKLHGMNDHAVLDDLTVKAGAGKVLVTAQVDHQSNALAFKAGLRSDKFPVVMDDQLYANATVQLSLYGTANGDLINVQKLSIPEAHLDLPDVKRKNLQELGKPEDIILTRNGLAIDKATREKIAARKAARQKAAVQQTLATGGSGDSGEPGTTDQRPPSGTGVAGSVPGKTPINNGTHVVTKAPAPTDKKPTAFKLVLDAPRNIWFKGYDVQAEVGFSDGFSVEMAGGPPEIFGEVKIIRGRADLLGKRFDVKRDSKVRFDGPVLRPNIDLAATYFNEKENVKVTINVDSDGQHFHIKPTSEPPLSETEIYTLLATGKSSLRSGGGGGGSSSTNDQAASIVGSLVASQVKSAISKVVPLDVLSVEAGDNGAGMSTSVEAGRYIGDRIYVGGKVRLGANPDLMENPWEARFEYEITKRWSLELTVGELRQDGDIVWTRDY